MKTVSIVFAAVLLASCGGGSGYSTPTPAPTPTPTPTPTGPILDSFGVDATGPDFAGGDAGADGSAGDGAPVVGGTVKFTDANGKTVSAVTNAKGYYRVKINGFTPPFVASVTETNGRVRYSLTTKAVKTNGFITVNLTGLTDKIASDVAKAGGKTGASQLTPQIVSLYTSTIDTSVQSLKTQLSGVITSSGLNASTFDPLGAPFVPDHTGYDYVLDNTVITVDATGATVVAVSPLYVPQSTPSQTTTLTGNWQQQMHYVSWNLPGSVPADPAPTSVLGANVPAAVAFTGNWIQSLAPQTTVSNGITTTITYSSSAANSYRATVVSSGNNSNYSQTLDFLFTNFSGCGACGVGSTVSYTITLTLNGLVGTSGGVTIPPSAPTTAIVTNTFTRLN